MRHSKTGAGLLADTQTHICDPSFDPDREAVLERAAAAGIDAVIAVGENLADAERNLEPAERYSLIWPAAGLYPTILDIEVAAENTAKLYQWPCMQVNR
jgi:TatD DNase family protein